MSKVFEPGPSLLKGFAPRECSSVIVVPARNEAEHLPACLQALAAQTDEDGTSVDTSTYEVILLLNNCTDESASVARQWQATHSGLCLHIVERSFAPHEANVGTARRLLMNTAWHRLRLAEAKPAAILSTDADTVVEPHWLCRTRCELTAGAAVVGGLVQLPPEELAHLAPHVQRAYHHDRAYAFLIARLENITDPQPCDPWPRHLDHFGASLACTREAYALAGGVPQVASLEDVAFIDALRRVDAPIRHALGVNAFTSSRLSGRTETGFSGQLRCWNIMEDGETEHRVLSAEFLHYRFRTLAQLRQIFLKHRSVELLPCSWRERVAAEVGRHQYTGEFLAAIDCDAFVDATFAGQRETTITDAITRLQALLRELDTAGHDQFTLPGPDTFNAWTQVL